LEMNWTRYASPEEIASVRGSPPASATAVGAAPAPTATSARVRSAPARSAAPRTAAHRRKGPRDKVFVVHGRNSQMRNAMFAFLRALDLKPEEWGQAMKATGKPMPYIAETLETALAGPNAVVVLMTPDEVVQLKRQFVATNDP